MSKARGWQTQAHKPSAETLQIRVKRGMALHQQGQLADAERVYEEILRRQPDHFDALHLLGMIALQKRQMERAVELIGKAIGYDTRVAAAHCNLGVALRALKRPEEALASYDRAIALQPDYAEAHYNRGNALDDLKRYGHALASYDTAIGLKPDYAEAYGNRCVALRRLNRPDEALISSEAAIKLKPNSAEAHNSRGNVLMELGRRDDALVSYRQAIGLHPDFGEAHLNHGLWLLQAGQFEQGWREHEWRKKCKQPLGVRSYAQPLWLGREKLAGQTLFSYWEQGFGDTIQFCRYAGLAEAQGARVILSVQQSLIGLLKQFSSTIQIIGPHESPAHFDYHCPLHSLPLAFGTTLETIPAQRRYLGADDGLRMAWSARLPATTRPRIGVVWSGSTDHINDHNRTVDLEQLRPVFALDADWICLQKEIREIDLTALRNIEGIAFFGDRLGDFSDTAALIDLMDLVITVDTSVAHLAGAMGKPVWILLPHNPDWRWLLDRNDSPWYPSATLFRQQQIGNWAGVVDQVKSELRSLFGSSKARFAAIGIDGGRT